MHFIVRNNVNLTLQNGKIILGRIDLYFWGFGGEAEFLRILGAKAKYFHGAGEFSLRDWGRSMHYF